MTGAALVTFGMSYADAVAIDGLPTGPVLGERFKLKLIERKT